MIDLSGFNKAFPPYLTHITQIFALSLVAGMLDYFSDKVNTEDEKKECFDKLYENYMNDKMSLGRS